MPIFDVLVTLVLLGIFVPISLLPLYVDPTQQDDDIPLVQLQK